MPLKRKCPVCGTSYPETATVCGNCPDNPPAALESGTRLDAMLMVGMDRATAISVGRENYLIDKVLGYGAMATAYLVTDGRNFKVIKEMFPNLKPKVQQKLEASFLREATIQEKVGKTIAASRISFQPFPKGYGWFDAHSRLFMVMDYMEGSDLEKVMSQLGSPMDAMQALIIAMEIGMVLKDYLHGYVNNQTGNIEPIIHRDIKPSNIQLLVGGTACLLDFGIARTETYGTGTMQRGGTRAGSPAFAAPEQLQKGGKATVRSDIFSLCATLYCLLANEEEFPEHRSEQLQAIDNLHLTLSSRLSDEIKNLLKKGTHEDEAGRFQNAAELCEELAKFFTKIQPLPMHLKSLLPAPAPTPVVTPPPLVNPVTAQNNPPPPITPRRVVAPPVQQNRVVVPVHNPTYFIVWENEKTLTINNKTEYQKRYIGQVKKVIQGNTLPADGSHIEITEIVDAGGGIITPTTSKISVSRAGRFQFDLVDTTVPIDCEKRIIYFDVQDSTGKVVKSDQVTIYKPGSWKAQMAKAATLVSNAVDAAKYLIIIGLLVVVISGMLLKAAPLILLAITLAPLAFGFKGGFGLIFRIMLSFIFGCIVVGLFYRESLQQSLRLIGGP